MSRNWKSFLWNILIKLVVTTVQFPSTNPDSKVRGANMGPTWVRPMLAPCTLLSGTVECTQNTRNRHFPSSMICHLCVPSLVCYTESKIHEANMGPIWGRHDPGGPHVGPVNLAVWVSTVVVAVLYEICNRIGPRYKRIGLYKLAHALVPFQYKNFILFFGYGDYH